MVQPVPEGTEWTLESVVLDIEDVVLAERLYRLYRHREANVKKFIRGPGDEEISAIWWHHEYLASIEFMRDSLICACGRSSYEAVEEASTSTV